MADEVDNAEILEQRARDLAIEKARQQASLFEKGEEGSCDYCGAYSLRIVGNACARCRDKYNLR